MTKKPTYEELEQRVRELEKESVERKRIEERLEEKEQTLKALLNAPPETAILTDLEGTILAVNEIAAQRIGKSSEELIGLEIFDYLPRDMARSRKAKADEVVRSGKPVRFQDEREGRFYDNNIYPVFDVEEKVSALAIYARDITETKRTEKALRESEEKYRNIIHESPVGISIYDASGQCVESNDSIARIVGTTKEQALQQNYNNIESWKESGLFDKAKSAIEDQSTKRHYLKVKSTFGKDVRLDCHLVPFSSGSLLLMVTDITEQKRAEEALQESEERLTFVLEGSQLGFWDWNIKTGEVQRNERWAEMLGYSIQEVEITVKHWKDLIHTDDRAVAWKSIQDHLEGRTPVHEIEYRMLCKDGKYKWILDRAKVVKHDPQGRPLRMSGTHSDITEHKRAEEGREKLIKELQEALKEIKTLRGILPLCSFCKKIRDDKGYWEQVDVYIHKHLQADISHGICPACAKEHYPDLDIHE